MEKFKEREKTALDKKIKAVQSEIRHERKKRRIEIMSENLQDEINSYLIKVSKPRNDLEKMLNSKMIKELGTVTTVKELSKFLKLNKNCIYKGMDTGEILSFRKGKRRFILTEGILPFLRDR